MHTHFEHVKLKRLLEGKNLSKLGKHMYVPVAIVVSKLQYVLFVFVIVETVWCKKYS